MFSWIIIQLVVHLFAVYSPSPNMFCGFGEGGWRMSWGCGGYFRAFQYNRVWVSASFGSWPSPGLTFVTGYVRSHSRSRRKSSLKWSCLNQGVLIMSEGWTEGVLDKYFVKYLLSKAKLHSNCEYKFLNSARWPESSSRKSSAKVASALR